MARSRTPRNRAKVLPGSDTTGKVRSFFCFMVKVSSATWGADGNQPHVSFRQHRQELGLVGAEGEVAVGAPSAAIEHDDRRAPVGDGVEGGGGAVGVEQVGVGQAGAGGGDAARGSPGGQIGLFAGEGTHDLVGWLVGQAGVHGADLLGNGVSGHSRLLQHASSGVSLGVGVIARPGLTSKSSQVPNRRWWPPSMSFEEVGGRPGERFPLKGDVDLLVGRWCRSRSVSFPPACACEAGSPA